MATAKMNRMEFPVTFLIVHSQKSNQYLTKGSSNQDYFVSFVVKFHGTWIDLM